MDKEITTTPVMNSSDTQTYFTNRACAIMASFIALCITAIIMTLHVTNCIETTHYVQKGYVQKQVNPGSTITYWVKP